MKNEISAAKFVAKEQHGDVNKDVTKIKASKIYNEYFTNGFSEQGIIMLIETILSSSTIDVDKMKTEIISEIKKYIDSTKSEEAKSRKIKNNIDKTQLFKFFSKDFKGWSISEIENQLTLIMNTELDENLFSRNFPNVKMLFDEWFESEVRIKYEERRPGRNQNVFGGKYGKFEYKMLQYKIALNQKEELIDLISEFDWKAE